MAITAAEREARRIVDSLRAGLDMPTRSADDIRREAIEQFTKAIDAKIRNMQEGEGLQITYRVDIIRSDGEIRGGSGSERNMPEYIAWRKAVMDRDGYTCQRCRSTRDLQAHHIKSWSMFPDHRFDVANGLTLCGDCHAAEHPHLRMVRRAP